MPRELVPTTAVGAHAAAPAGFPGVTPSPGSPTSQLLLRLPLRLRPAPPTHVGVAFAFPTRFLFPCRYQWFRDSLMSHTVTWRSRRTPSHRTHLNVAAHCQASVASSAPYHGRPRASRSGAAAGLSLRSASSTSLRTASQSGAGPGWRGGRGDWKGCAGGTCGGRRYRGRRKGGEASQRRNQPGQCRSSCGYCAWYMNAAG